MRDWTYTMKLAQLKTKDGYDAKRMRKLLKNEKKNRWNFIFKASFFTET